MSEAQPGSRRRGSGSTEGEESSDESPATIVVFPKMGRAVTRDDVKPWHDASTLVWCYWKCERSLEECGKTLGCSGRTVQRSMIENGVPRR